MTDLDVTVEKLDDDEREETEEIVDPPAGESR